MHDTLNSERFVDQAPTEVYATLLDAGKYLCSVRTMYRILEEHAELRERRDQLRHPNYEKPVLLATGPNQVWSWDITKLLGPMKWVYFHLYVILDIFSRYVVGWMLAERESAELAKRLIKETCSKQGIVAEQLTLHADRGTSRRCCTARSKSLTSLCRLQSHPAQYVSGIPSAAILLSISHPIWCSTRCLANVRARISGPMIAL